MHLDGRRGYPGCLMQSDAAVAPGCLMQSDAAVKASFARCRLRGRDLIGVQVSETLLSVESVPCAETCSECSKCNMSLTPTLTPVAGAARDEEAGEREDGEGGGGGGARIDD
jgi:hypothetical protein